MPPHVAVKLCTPLPTVSLVIMISLTGHPIAPDANDFDIFAEVQPMSETQTAVINIFFITKAQVFSIGFFTPNVM